MQNLWPVKSRLYLQGYREDFLDFFYLYWSGRQGRDIKRGCIPGVRSSGLMDTLSLQTSSQKKNWYHIRTDTCTVWNWYLKNPHWFLQMHWYFPKIAALHKHPPTGLHTYPIRRFFHTMPRKYRLTHFMFYVEHGMCDAWWFTSTRFTGKYRICVCLCAECRESSQAHTPAWKWWLHNTTRSCNRPVRLSEACRRLCQKLFRCYIADSWSNQL